MRRYLPSFSVLQCFEAAVRHLNFTRAAEELGITPSGVSRQVRALETFLGIRLLERFGSRLVATHGGAAYAREIGERLDQIQAVTVEIMMGQRADGALLIGSLPTLGLRWLAPRLTSFTRKHPEIQLDMGVSDRIVDVIGDNVDAVLRGGEVTVPSLIARRIGELPLGVYAAPSYLDATGVPAHPRDIEADPQRIVGFLRASTGRIAPIQMRRGEESVEVRGRYVVAADDGNAYLAAGLAGMGVLWLPRYMAGPHAARGELVPLLEDWTMDPMPMYLAYPPNRNVSAKLRVFIDWIDELMRRHAPAIVPAAPGEG